MEPLTFRPRRSGGVLGLVLGSPTLAFGLVASSLKLFASSVEPEVWVAMALGGATAVYCGSGYLRMRTVADNTGLRRFPAWFDGFQVRWVDVVSWSVEPLDPIDNPDGCQILWVLVAVRRRSWWVRIADYEVSQPGFGVLVEQVKTRLAERDLARGSRSSPSSEEAKP